MDELILVVGDSLPLPADGVDYRDTWVHKLKMKTGYEVMVRCRGARTTTSLRSTTLLEKYDPDIVVTQIGIVDCAPRYSNRVERVFFEGAPKVDNILFRNMKLFTRISRKYERAIKKLKIRRPKRSYVSREQFGSNLENYYKRAQENDADVYSIKIAPPSTSFVKKNPLVDDEIKKYNTVYDELSEAFDNLTLVDPYAGVDNIDEYFIDEEHPNGEGHHLIFNSLQHSLGLN